MVVVVVVVFLCPRADKYVHGLCAIHAHCSSVSEITMLLLPFSMWSIFVVQKLFSHTLVLLQEGLLSKQV